MLNRCSGGLWPRWLVAGVLGAALAGPGWASEGVITYAWRIFNGDRRVDKEQPRTSVTVPLELLTVPRALEFSDSVDMFGPMQTMADVSVHGKVNLLARSLSVGAQAHAKVNSYDPRTPPPDPVLLTATATAEAGFVDRVLVFDPTLSPNAPIRFQVQPLLTSGEMVIQHGSLGGGVARMVVAFSMVPRFASAQPFLLNYEKVLVTDSAGSSSAWNASELGGLLAMAGGPITVPNGSLWDISFVVSTTLQSLPSALPAENPRGTLATSDFRNTVHWNGLTAATDDQGQPLTHLSLQSELGFDWLSAAAVPEPPAGLLMLAGLAGLGGLQSRRRVVGLAARPRQRLTA